MAYPRKLVERFGFKIFPVTAGGKSPPLFENNLERATDDARILRGWAMSWPNANWAAALARSHLIVMDVDSKDAKVGADTLERLQLEHGLLPETFTASTPSQGRHYYFSETARVKHRMKVSAWGPDIDSTNYVLLPGSVLRNGRYSILIDAPIADAPDWFAEYLAPSVGDNSEADQTPAVELDQVPNIARAIFFLKYDAPASIMGRNGERTLLMVAAVLKDLGMSKSTTIELLDRYYNVKGRCDPLWSIGEGEAADRLDAKVDNAWRYLTKQRPGVLGFSPADDFGRDPL